MRAPAVQARIGRLLPPPETFPVTLTRVVLAPPVHLVVQVQEPAPDEIVAARYQPAPGVTVTREEGLGSFIEYWEYELRETPGTAYYTEEWYRTTF